MTSRRYQCAIVPGTVGIVTLPFAIAPALFRDSSAALAVGLGVAARIIPRGRPECESLASRQHDFVRVRHTHSRNARIAMTAAALDYGLPACGARDRREAERLGSRRSPRLGRVGWFLTLFPRSLSKWRRHRCCEAGVDAVPVRAAERSV